MIDLRGALSPEQRIVLAVDTSDLYRARELAFLARDAGATIIKQGLELSSAPGANWAFASDNAAQAGLDWVADTKADDISATVGGFMRNIVQLDHPPIAITMQTHAGTDAMKEAQDIAIEHGIVMLGVTELTSVKEDELRRQFGFVLARLGLGELPEECQGIRSAFVHMRATEAHIAGLTGLVASANELISPIKSDPNLQGMLTMIPGTRSPGADTHDQYNVQTPEAAIAAGADLLVIGREITGSQDSEAAFLNVVSGIRRGLALRATK